MFALTQASKSMKATSGGKHVPPFRARAIFRVDAWFTSKHTMKVILLKDNSDPDPYVTKVKKVLRFTYTNWCRVQKHTMKVLLLEKMDSEVVLFQRFALRLFVLFVFFL